jgi:hypothetical protein
MRRRGSFVWPLLVVLTVIGAACSDSDGGSEAKGTAITVDDTTISAADFVDELRIIADNDEFADLLKREDDTKLAPRDGTIEQTLSSAWVSNVVNQVLADREFERRDLEVTPKIRAQARKNAAELFRGRKVFDAFPESFRKLVTERQARQDAVVAELPKKIEPTEAELLALYPGVEQNCQQGKLVAQIYVDTKQEADAVAAELAQGADFATLARERSLDPSKDRGGLTMCIGSTRWTASVEEVQQAVQSTPIGGTTAPIDYGDGYTIIRVLPLSYETARPLIVDDWHGKHPSAFYDLLANARKNAKISAAKRFAIIHHTENGPAIAPPLKPVEL